MNPAVMTNTFEPSELAFLKRVLNDVCLERGVTDGSATATELAAEMIHLYQLGIKDEPSLHKHFNEHG